MTQAGFGPINTQLFIHLDPGEFNGEFIDEEEATGASFYIDGTLAASGSADSRTIIPAPVALPAGLVLMGALGLWHRRRSI